MKALGFSLFLLAGWGWGWSMAAFFRRRPKELWAWSHALSLMASEVEHAALPLPRVWGRLAREGEGLPAKVSRRALSLWEGGLRDPGDAWRRALGELGEESSLFPDDQELLLRLSPLLGRTGREDQVRHLRWTAAQLEARARQVEGVSQEKARLVLYLSFSGAAAVALLLL
ncbi:MAG: stage III sporulation protein AB [Clostridiales bacterium]|nr:stage III sporulation protein AB [Clostridiales bacterium]